MQKNGKSSRLMIKKRNTEKAVLFTVKDYARSDLGFANNLMRYTIYFIFVLNTLTLITFPIIGYDDLGYYGGLSTTMDLPMNTFSAIVELSFELLLIYLFSTIVRYRFQNKLERELTKDKK